MHELYLAQSLLQQVTKLAHENKASKVLKVKISIGPLSGIVVDSFKFGFDALKRESSLTSKAGLEIETQPLVLYCMECSREFQAPDSWPRGSTMCPGCGGQSLLPKGEDEIVLQQLVME